MTLTGFAQIRCALTLGALWFMVGCAGEPGAAPLFAPQKPTANVEAPLGQATLRGRGGAVDLLQVQAEVEAFVDRYVLQVSQATDQLGRTLPEFHDRLDTVRLAIARGAYGIATGPNPVASLLDIIVQTALVRSSVERHFGAQLPPDAASTLLEVLARGESEAWALGQRVLSPQDVTDLRNLIDTWIAENPQVVYVAGIRFADFSRLRPKEGESQSIFGLLRLDPFASIDPAAREMQEARLLTERIFYYSQRMPQLIAWQTEALYRDLLSTVETRRFLANVESFARTTETMAADIQRLPEQVERHLTGSTEAVSEVTADVNQTLAKIDQTSANLRELGDAATQTAKAWESAIEAANQVAGTFAQNQNSSPADQGEPFEMEQVISVLKESQNTARDLRELLRELDLAASEGSVQHTIGSSIAQARRDVQSIIITSTVCAVVVIAVIFAGGVGYRAVVRSWETGR